MHSTKWTEKVNTIAAMWAFVSWPIGFSLAGLLERAPSILPNLAFLPPLLGVGLGVIVVSNGIRNRQLMTVFGGLLEILSGITLAIIIFGFLALATII